MSPAQRNTVTQLVAEGFQVTRATGDMVRLTKGADNRLVRTDGSQKRALGVPSKGVRS
jgi:hypothetical protein